MSGVKAIRGGLCALVLLAILALPAVAGADASTTRPLVGAFGDFQRPESVAVDDSNGDVYVLDAGAGTVSRFDSDLQPKDFPALGTNVIDGSSPLGCDLLCDGTPANGFSFVAKKSQLAVDNSGSPLTDGDIYVTDPRHRVVDVFASSGTYLGQLTAAGGSGPRLGEPCGVAVDPGGDVYVADGARAEVDRYVRTANSPADPDFASSFPVRGCSLAAGAGSSAGALFASWDGWMEKLDATGAFEYLFNQEGEGRGVAVDPASGHVLVAVKGEVNEYIAGASQASFVTSFGSMQLQAAAGVAVDGPRSRVYVTDTATGRVDAYGPPAPVSAPAVVTGPVTPLPNGRESLTGYVDAESAPTSYYFEFGAADCSQGPCATAPEAEDARVGKGLGPVRVSQELSGLQPGTTYHYRLVAVNGGGTARSGDRTFTTTGTAPSGACANAALRSRQGLPQTFPNCRAYELVSTFAAAERNNIDVLVNAQRVRAAADGGAFEFATLGGAGDARSVGVTSEYTAARLPGSGWVVHGISPPQSNLPAVAVSWGGEARYVEFTPSLSRGIFLSASPVNEEGPNVARLRSLYRREDLAQSGPGRYRLLSDAATLQTRDPGEGILISAIWPPNLVGASTDLSHVYFESERALTADAASLEEGTGLYESVDGTVHLASVLPASEGGGPTLAKGGQGNGTYNRRAVSADGSRLLFTAYAMSDLGVREKRGRLYLRDNHGTAAVADDTTVKVNASEKTNGGGPGGGDPGGEQPATFWDASRDLSQIFLTSTEALTDDAPTDEPAAEKLYRYDLDAPIGSRLTLLSVDRNPEDGLSDGVSGVIGVSDDGSHVYFVASSQLVPGLPGTSTPAIFVWRQGQIHEVAPVTASDVADGLFPSEGWEDGAKWARVSPDGRQLAFLADAASDPTGQGQGSTCQSSSSSPCRGVYLYSVSPSGEEALWCASCRLDGRPGGGDADFAMPGPLGVVGSLLVTGDPYLNRALSADGGFLFFTSTERLSPHDENDAADVYELDTASGAIQLLSGGRAGTASYFLDASEDGRDVFFATRSSLLGADRNQSIDVYDARVEGGFEESPPAPAPPCTSTAACRPATTVAPGDALAAAGPVPESAGKSRHGHRRKHRKAKHRNRLKHRQGGHRRG